MFQWDNSINAINVPACKVVHLFRSMREVQLALPGISAQQASAYLCQYQTEGGVGTVAAFHLHKSQLLAFYFSDPHIVPEQKTDSMLDQGLNFVESMGFLMTDQDIHLLDDADQEMLWASLPIKTGLADKREPQLSRAPVEKPAEENAEKIKTNSGATFSEEKKDTPTKVANNISVTKEPPSYGPEKSDQKPEPHYDAAENVDDLLAAIEAMRAKRPGLRARKSLPPIEEMERRRLQLRETVGRILASL